VIIIRVGVSFGVFFSPDSITFSHVTEAEAGGWFNSLAIIASILFSLNLILFVFNLMPLPPLDGSALIPIFLNEQNANMYKMFISRPGFGIVGLIIAWQVFDFIFSPIHLLAINLLYPGAHYG
jgi:Zn-dependent protease